MVYLIGEHTEPVSEWAKINWPCIFAKGRTNHSRRVWMVLEESDLMALLDGWWPAMGIALSFSEKQLAKYKASFSVEVNSYQQSDPTRGRMQLSL